MFIQFHVRRFDLDINIPLEQCKRDDCMRMKSYKLILVTPTAIGLLWILSRLKGQIRQFRAGPRGRKTECLLQRLSQRHR